MGGTLGNLKDAWKCFLARTFLFLLQSKIQATFEENVRTKTVK